MKNPNPKVYLEVHTQGLKIQYENCPNYQVVRAILIDGIKAIDYNIQQNSTVREKSDLIIPDNEIVKPS